MKRILIVDDAMFMRNTLKMMLKNESYEIVGEAENGIKAIDQFKALKPDIVTMDIHMPDMDGIDALTEIIKLNSKAKVVMISASGDQKHLMEAMRLGAANYIIKPFTEEKVLKVIRSL